MVLNVQSRYILTKQLKASLVIIAAIFVDGRESDLLLCRFQGHHIAVAPRQALDGPVPWVIRPLDNENFWQQEPSDITVPSREHCRNTRNR